MTDQRTKDPERVRTGRLGGLTTAARGAHVTVPGRRAWEAALAAEYGITDDLPEPERRRRMDAALRLRMSRMARARWGNRKAGAAIGSPAPAKEDRRAAGAPRPAA